MNTSKDCTVAKIPSFTSYRLASFLSVVIYVAVHESGRFCATVYRPIK